MSEHGFHLLVAVMASALVEHAILFLAPRWLARLAFLRLRPERTFRLTPAQRERREALSSLLSRLPERADVGDSVLYARGPEERSLTLRRTFGGRKQIWILRIDVERRGDEIALRAKEGFFPLVWLPIPPYLVAWLLSRAITAKARDADLEEAYDLIERTIRAT